jgi:hypothetical protein
MNQAGDARRRVFVVWVVLAALIAGIATLEYRNRSRIPEGAAEKIHGAEGSRMLMPVVIEEIAAVELVQGGTMHRFERDATGAWFYHGVHAGTQAIHAHQTDPQQAERIEKAFAALGRTRMERFFKLDILNAYGVTSPKMVILVYGKGNSQPLAQYAVGDLAPDGLSRYVLRVGSASVVTIANYQITNLLDLIQAVGGNKAPARRIEIEKRR